MRRAARIDERHAERQSQSQRDRSFKDVAAGEFARFRSRDQCVDTESLFVHAYSL